MLSDKQKAAISPLNFLLLPSEMRVLVYSFALGEAVRRPIIFHGPGHLLAARCAAKQTPYRIAFPIGLFLACKQIQAEIWAHFSKSMKLQLVLEDFYAPNWKNLKCGIAAHDPEAAPNDHPSDLFFRSLSIDLLKSITVCVDLDRRDERLDGKYLVTDMKVDWSFLLQMKALKNLRIFFSVQPIVYDEETWTEEDEKWVATCLSSLVFHGFIVNLITSVPWSVTIDWSSPAEPLEKLNYYDETKGDDVGDDEAEEYEANKKRYQFSEWDEVEQVWRIADEKVNLSTAGDPSNIYWDFRIHHGPWHVLPPERLRGLYERYVSLRGIDVVEAVEQVTVVTEAVGVGGNDAGKSGGDGDDVGVVEGQSRLRTNERKELIGRCGVASTTVGITLSHLRTKKRPEEVSLLEAVQSYKGSPIGMVWFKLEC
ncbi:hypothetical protein EJ08DRAFT_60126 [Tothia fuscella]|uniref:Uncharacterized protein n=1 Tax=Tothia fuscella TaxID=1048955 RepID=A0A9P4U0H5_9PEZI|nr:hypothetical protein EJ08DRAFT_60126 [Tothia fuscella]